MLGGFALFDFGYDELPRAYFRLGFGCKLFGNGFAALFILISSLERRVFSGFILQKRVESPITVRLERRNFAFPAESPF